MKSGHRTAVVLLVAAAALWAMSTGDAYSTGQPDAGAYQGCGGTVAGGCHSLQPASEVSTTLSGVPAEYTSGETYTLTIKGNGGPAASGENTGGFYLEASGGTLEAKDGSARIVDGGKVAIHTVGGNDQRSWKVDWTAPSSGTVSFTAYVNLVNGDGLNGEEDVWNAAQAKSAGSKSTPGPALTVTAAGLVALVAIARRRR